MVGLRNARGFSDATGKLWQGHYSMSLRGFAFSFCWVCVSTFSKNQQPLSPNLLLLFTPKKQNKIIPHADRLYGVCIVVVLVVEIGPLVVVEMGSSNS